WTRETVSVPWIKSNVFRSNRFVVNLNITVPLRQGKGAPRPEVVERHEPTGNRKVKARLCRMADARRFEGCDRAAIDAREHLLADHVSSPPFGCRRVRRCQRWQLGHLTLNTSTCDSKVPGTF